MDTGQALWIVAMIVVPQVVVWAVIIRRLHRNADRIREIAQGSGDSIVLGPERADYQGWNRRYGWARTMGTMALTERRIIFKRAIGADIEIPLTEIGEVSDTVSLGRIRHTFGNYLALRLSDGTEIVFLVRNQQRWMTEIRARAAAA